MKLATSLLSLALLSGAAFAEGKMHNFYLGAQAGVAGSFGEFKPKDMPVYLGRVSGSTGNILGVSGASGSNSAATFTVAADNRLSGNYELGKAQAQGGLYVGYLMVNNDFGIGIELYGGADGAKVEQKDTNSAKYYGAVNAVAGPANTDLNAPNTQFINLDVAPVTGTFGKLGAGPVAAAAVGLGNALTGSQPYEGPKFSNALTCKRPTYYGFAARLGYHIMPKALFYVRLGIEGGKWSCETKQLDADGKAIIKDGKEVSLKNDKNSLSFAPGAGLELCLAENVCLRMEYRFIAGPTVTIDNGTPAKVKIAEFKLTQHAMTLGVGYRF